MAVPPIQNMLAMQMALQRRLRGIDATVPRGSMFPGTSPYPQGRFPPIMPMPPVAGLRQPQHAPQIQGQYPSYRPLPRY